MAEDLQTADPMVNMKEEKNMITKPQATCPRCKSTYNVFDATWVGPHAETVVYYAECDCGAADISVSRGQIQGISPRAPIEIPEYEDIPIGTQDDPQYMAQ